MTASTRIVAIIAALLFLLASPGEAAFLYGYDAHPNLGTLAEVQAGTAFRLRVDLVTNDKKNNAEQQSRLAFNGPVVELLNDPAKLKSHDLVSASFAKLSSGGKKFKVLENAFFVGMSGMEKIVFEEDYWEMIWREDVRAGKLVCVFNLPFPVRRNGAQLDAGKLYVDFPVYSAESLAEGLKLKYSVIESNKEHMMEKDKEIDLMRKTNNPFMKMMHYRNAFAAYEKILMNPVVDAIPEDSDVIQLPSGLHLAKEGGVYKKNSDNILLGPSYTKLGAAFLSKYNFKTEDDPKSDKSRLMP